jgi:hypothetical protein
LNDVNIGEHMGNCWETVENMLSIIWVTFVE